MALFEVRGLKKGVRPNVVLDGLDLDIFDGEVVTIIGESGSGKSVLLKAMMGLVEVDAGTIRFDGDEVTGQTERSGSRRASASACCSRSRRSSIRSACSRTSPTPFVSRRR